MEAADSVSITVNGKFSRKPVTFMIDSGATSNIVPAKMINGLNCRTTIINRVDIQMANGKTVPATKQVETVIHLPQGQFLETFLVAEIRLSSVILGGKFLRKHDAIIKYKDLSMIIPKRVKPERRGKTSVTHSKPQVSTRTAKGPTQTRRTLKRTQVEKCVANCKKIVSRSIESLNSITTAASEKAEYVSLSLEECEDESRKMRSELEDRDVKITELTKLRL